MNHLIKGFASLYSLTPRETDILTQLVNKVSNFKEIAEKLGVSPNTVSNHFGSIFHKTKTNSKSELMAVFIKYLLKSERTLEQFRRLPVALVVDDERDICDMLSEALVAKGIKVVTCAEPSRVLELVERRKIDVVISDIRMPKMDGVELLKQLRKKYPYYPPFIFITGYSDHSLESVLSLGAVALLDKPIDLDKLFQLIMEQYVDDPMDRNRPERAETDVAVRVDSKLDLKIKDIGRGGVFIPMKEPTYQVGEQLQFEFNLGENGELIKALGEIVWVRNSSADVEKNGLGVKFLNLSAKDRAHIEEFVHYHKVMSFIPSPESSNS